MGKLTLLQLEIQERVFVFYELGNHKTYKIQFIDYASGVMVFKYESL